MATNGYQVKPSQALKTLLGVLLLMLVPLVNSLANSQEPTPNDQPPQEIEAPDNWYQVEVILFTQNGNMGGEAPPQQYQLDFPQNWLTLIDPNMPLEQDGFPLAQGSLLYPSNQEDAQRIIPLAVVADPLIADDGLFGGGSLMVDVSKSINSAWEPEDIDMPQYEAPFVLLPKELRDLNDSAAALDRRQYNVVFHEAWRFAADENAADPWVIIKAGQRFEDRFQLEGSLRFYKSRFLHFESNLWLLKFANANPDNPVKSIYLPDFPRVPEVTEDKSSFDSRWADSIPAAGADEQVLMTDAFEERTLEKSKDALITNPLAVLAHDLDTDVTLTPGPDITDKDLRQTYPVETVWLLEISKRIEGQAIYYIDHPEMGIMVTIKSFTPELLNPPQPMLEPQSPEFAQDVIALPVGQ